MLTSSALGGRKAPPKAPPRRRNAQQAISKTAPAEETTQDAERSEATQVLPSTDQSGTSATTIPDETRLPSPPVAVEHPITEIAEQDLETLPPAVRTSIEQIQTTAETQERGNVVPDATNNASEVANCIISASAPKQTRKRGAPSVVARRSSKRIRREEVQNAGEAASSTAQTAPFTNEGTITGDTTSNTARSRRRAARNTRTEQDEAQPTAHEETEDVQNASQVNNITATAATQNSDTASSERAANPSAGEARPRRTRTRRARTRGAEIVAEAVAGEADQIDDDETSESDPEQHEIDPSSLSMYDLSHDARHGRTSAREKKMAKIDWGAVAEKRRQEAEAIARGERRREQDSEAAAAPAMEADDDANQQHDGANEEDAVQEDDSRSRPGPITRASTGGVRFRIVGGQIVEDETSLTIDRAARIEETINDTAGEPAEEEENLTVRLNRTTYMNDRRRDETERVPNYRRKSDAWSEEETDRFYDALRHFGTDFFIISKMFPPKTRRHIKMKFVREERLEPDRINAVLLGQADPRNRINLAEYAQAIDRDVNDFQKYDSLAHANEVIKASMKDKEEEMRAAVKQEEESVRQRELQRQQREKQKLEMEKKRDERNRKKQLKRRGEIYSTGTFGAADDDDFGSFARPTLPDFDDE